MAAMECHRCYMSYGSSSVHKDYFYSRHSNVGNVYPRLHRSVAEVAGWWLWAVIWQVGQKSDEDQQTLKHVVELVRDIGLDNVQEQY